MLWFCYSHRKKAVRAATIRKWPGNSIPNFKKSSASLLELSALADELAEECSYPPVGFLKPQIRQHILDILNERRRSVRKGHDYTSVCFFFFTYRGWMTWQMGLKEEIQYFCLINSES